MRKIQKWYKKVGFYLINGGLSNVFIIFCAFSPQIKLDIKKLLEVAKEWANDHSAQCSYVTDSSSCATKKASQQDLS